MKFHIASKRGRENYQDRKYFCGRESVGTACGGIYFPKAAISDADEKGNPDKRAVSSGGSRACQAVLSDE
jgi:hypothetical protein